MTQNEYDNNELARDLESNEPEILRDDFQFDSDMSDEYTYEALALGNDNPFIGEW